MELTTQVLQKYKGGQMEIQRGIYFYCGEVESIKIEEDELQVIFKWLAEGEGSIQPPERFPQPPERWIKANSLDYTVSIEPCMAIYGDPNSADGAGDRLYLNSPPTFAGEAIILYPPNDSRLDPANVEGL